MRNFFTRNRPSPAMVVALIALMVAMGGTGYAATRLPRNSVGSKQIKRNAVSTSKVKNASLLAADFAAGQLPAGEKGDKGDPGDEAIDAFARVDGNGALVGGTAQNKGVDATDVQHENTPATTDANTSPTGPGVYCFGGLGFTPTSAVVSLDNTDAMPTIPAVQGGSLNFIPSASVFKGEDLSRCDAAHGQVRVAIERVDQTNPPELVNHGFFIWFEG
jgi:hypothetical protein